MTTQIGETPLTRFLTTQTLTQLRALRGQYRDEIEAAKARAAVLEAEVEQIDHAIRIKSFRRSIEGSLRKLDLKVDHALANANGRKRASGPALRELVLDVMRQREGSWSKQQIFDVLDKRGVAPKGKNPLNTIGNRLLEMHARSEIQRVGRGSFALRDDDGEDAEIAGDSAGQQDDGPIGTPLGVGDKGPAQGGSRQA